MSLRDKVYSLRAEYRKSKIFFINNPSIADQQYFGVFATADGYLHYDFGSLSAIHKYRNERLSSGITKKYKVLGKNEFVKMWFDYEFWLYCMNFSNSTDETNHYKHKIEKIIQQLFFF